MHVVVTNMANDGNRGDLAILAGTVVALRAAEPGIRVSIAPTEIGRRQNLDGAAMADSTALADGRLVASPVPARVDDGWPARQWAFRITRALASETLHQPWLGGSLDSDFRDVMDDADLVIAKGGSYLFSYPGVKQALFATRMLHSLRVAKSVQTPAVVLGTSLGPVQDRMRGYFSKMLGSCRSIVTREEISFLFAHERLGLNNVQRGVDMAFALYNPMLAAGTRSGIAITPRELPFEPPEARNRYEAAVAATIDLLTSETGERCYLAVQVDRDRSLCERLASRVARTEDVEVVHVDTLPLAGLIQWYGQRNMLIGTRLHSVILAALTHTPSIILECDPPKMIGISEQLGLDDWRLRAGSDEIRSLPGSALRCFEARHEKAAQLPARLQALSSEAHKQTKVALSVAQ